MTYRLLVAEDELEERNYLTHIISTHYDGQDLQIIASCGNGEEAINQGLALKPDIALLDIEMPKVNGLEVARKLKEDNPGMQIVMITAYGTFTYARQALRIGVTDYLVKPYVEAQLFSLLDELIERLVGIRKTAISRIVTLLNTTGNEAETHPIARMVVQYIDLHYAEKISLESMSSDLKFSSSYVSKCIKKYLHASFTQLLMEKRGTEAAKLLLKENITVNEVAYAVGFSDPNYFYKCFKDQFGIQPKKYAQAVLARIDNGSSHQEHPPVV